MVTTTGGVPVPLSATVTSPPVMLPPMVTTPVREPVWVGANVTSMEQLAPLITACPRHLAVSLSVSAKSPLALIEVISSGLAPALVSTTVCALLVVPSASLPKVSDAGDAVSVVEPSLAVNSGVIQMPRP